MEKGRKKKERVAIGTWPTPERTLCPYCKEGIIANAILCKHCHTSLPSTREEMMIAEITERLAPAPAIKRSVSYAEALCYFKFRSDKVALQQCLDDAKIASGTALVAEKLHRELSVTIMDVIWGGGDIDPIPFEKSVKERFSHPLK